MEAAVVQLIKTAVIKAGNSPAAFVAVAQCCPAAGAVHLLCESPQFPRQPDGPPHRSGLHLGARAVRGSSPGRHAVLRVRSSSIYVVPAVCPACATGHCPVRWLPPSAPPRAARASGSLSSQQQSAPSLPGLPGCPLLRLPCRPLPLPVPPAGQLTSLSLGCSPTPEASGTLHSHSSQICSNPNISPVL